jgi:hypothetical protein
MNNLRIEERAEMEQSMDLALEQFFNSILDCIVIEEK